MTAKKIGRPKSAQPKIHEIRTRVDERTLEDIENVCQQQKITRSVFLRRAISVFLENTKKGNLHSD